MLQVYKLCISTKYRLLVQMGTGKISASPFYFFFYVCNDSANAVEDFGRLFFANGQFFLKFSKIYKKINFGPFFMHISLYGGNRGNTLKMPLSTTYMVKNMPSKCLKNAKF